MIASRRKAPRYGKGRASGLLVVDGRDETLFRKVAIGFKPRTRGQRRALLGLLAACQETYNGALQERRDAYRHPSRTKVPTFDQFDQLTELRQLRPDLFMYGLQPLRSTIKRVDEAFGRFFDRVKDGQATGQKAGYPRFKSRARFDTVSYDEPVSWSLHLDERYLTVQGMGDIDLSPSAVRQLRRYVERGGVATTVTLTRADREGEVWRASVGFKNLLGKDLPCPSITTGTTVVPVGLDRGVVVPIAAGTTTGKGTLYELPGDVQDRLETLRRRIEDLQRQRAGKKKYGRAWRSLSKQIKRAHAKAANITDNWARQTAKQIVATAEVVALEDLNLPGMTKSAKGTLEEPGTNVAAKSGLNRSLAEAAPGKLGRWVLVKAEEAGRRAWLVPAQYTSQQCSQCRVIDASNRISRDVFYCSTCGHYDHADLNAGGNVAARALTAEDAWSTAGAPSLKRPKPRLRRRKTDVVEAERPDGTRDPGTSAPLTPAA